MLRMLFFTLLIVYSVNAEEFKPTQNKKINWKFDGITGYFDRESIQRGYKVYKEVCAACHSMKRVAFRNLKDIGFSKEEIEQIAASYLVNDGPNELGEMFERNGKPSDYFVPPFKNKEVAAATNNGVAPPDLSLIIKARHDGSNYVYSLLTGYPNVEQNKDGTYINPYFPAGKLAMAPPLTDGLVTYDNGKQATVENMAYDVVNFLHWASEPELEARHKLGLKVISYLITLTILFIVTNNKLWKTLYKATH